MFGPDLRLIEETQLEDCLAMRYRTEDPQEPRTGDRVVAEFQAGLFEGNIVKRSTTRKRKWWVKFDDGDDGDMELEELCFVNRAFSPDDLIPSAYVRHRASSLAHEHSWAQGRVKKSGSATAKSQQWSRRVLGRSGEGGGEVVGRAITPSGAREGVEGDVWKVSAGDRVEMLFEHQGQDQWFGGTVASLSGPKGSSSRKNTLAQTNCRPTCAE